MPRTSLLAIVGCLLALAGLALVAGDPEDCALLLPFGFISLGVNVVAFVRVRRRKLGGGYAAAAGLLLSLAGVGCGIVAMLKLALGTIQPH